MLDALIVGAGPAGSIAALVLARAGARVVVVDRETFPRDKLCGDTLNPGALDLLASLGLGGGPIARGYPLAGMTLTGPRGQVTATYGVGRAGRAVRRQEFDAWLLERAIDAGARFESALVARQPLFRESRDPVMVRGVVLSRRGRPNEVVRMPASIVIAADGHRSGLGRALGLIRPPVSPRRWAFGVYARGVAGMTRFGEMHVRPEKYIGIAPMPDGLANVCVVTGPRPEGREPLEVIAHAIGADEELVERFRSTTFVGRPRVLGPLASDAVGTGVDGLLLAGDAAGFIDPMTGDGLQLAMRGAVLAADEALRALESSDFAGAPRRLAAARREALGAKLRFNRLVRAATCSPAAIGLLSRTASIAPGLMRPVIRYAGDVH